MSNERSLKADGRTLGIVGAGKLGITLARLARAVGAVGADVNISGSGEPSRIALTTSVIAPGALPMTTDDVMANSDVIVLALPLRRARELANQPDVVRALRDKSVLDVMNYWWDIDGEDDDLKHPQPSSSEMVQRWFAGARIVKAFNHIGYHDLEDFARPDHTEGRIAMALASDDTDASREAAAVIDRLGFEPVTLTSLSAGQVLDPGRPAFGARVPAQELRELIQ